MNRFAALDCLCPRLLRVDAEQRYREVTIAGEKYGFFAVFEGDGAYLGIITERQAALFPDRIFADLLVNKAFTDTTGYAEDEVRGRSPGMLSSGRHDKAFYRTMWQSIGE